MLALHTGYCGDWDYFDGGIMNDNQNAVLGVTVVAFIIALVFFVPWRVESTDAIQWAPIYRRPIIQSQSYRPDMAVDRYMYANGHIATGVYVLEIVLIVVSGVIGYVICSDEAKK